MTKFSSRFLFILISCVVLITSCNNNKAGGESGKAVLDTVSLSSKNFSLAYQDGDKIVATSIDTMKQISFGGATDPAISPDGNKLAYTLSDSAGYRSIWVADMENKSQGKLQVNGNNYYQAMWSADGGAIAFSIFNRKNLWKIGVIKTDNSGYVMLDSASKINVYAPTWKNEKEIIGQDLTKLYTFDLTGKLIDTKLIADLIGKEFSIASSNRFFYTKDGAKLIFNAGNTDILDGLTGPSEAVYILDLASKKVQRISPKGINVAYVFVTADDRIFYSGAEKPFAQSKIYVSDLNGNIKTVVDKGTNPTGALK
ncbi:Tol biopolymer transport system component [Pedobacter sp. AK013]|uniref:PD40 domain-containing protein n=1 Tax=Pedobacter sp. AK013 TaxID=2723071 RepID=UPI001622A714|nr:PD40 domain-containing protein [Pedobacter sp. AK013]MBB6237374.1 Tol biopolymer transport system component [Pedobacter sp. AK013]